MMTIASSTDMMITPRYQNSSQLNSARVHRKANSFFAPQ
jgi:hypothetical protein